MIILGVNGEYGHDASACLVVDGKLIAYSEEERISRQKHAPMQLPINSIMYCLNSASISMNEVDYVANSTTLDYGRIRSIKSRMEFQSCRFPKIIGIDHHLSHATAAYHFSGLSDAIVLVIDGQGDSQSTTIALAKDQNIKILEQYDITQSLGYFYNSVTSYLGLGNNGEGKLMGLASYGEPKYELPIQITTEGYAIPIKIASKDTIDNQRQKTLKWWNAQLYKLFGDPPNIRYYYDSIQGCSKLQFEYSQYHKDIAASAQKHFEDAVLNLIKNSIKKYNCKNLVFCGGSALNCSLNGLIERSKLCDNFYVFPAVNDAGTCIGAAYEANKQLSNIVLDQGLSTPYWEQDFTNSMIKEYLDKNSINYKYHENITTVVSKLLMENKVISWFQGKGEMGPRALGNRSIIANPTFYDNHIRINKYIKGRELWRPFAPSILEEYASDYFYNIINSPFMLKSYYVNENVINKIPAVVHIDNTARPQTVNQESNKIWYDLLCQFYEKSGIPLLLNTSMNERGVPICNSPRDALQTFIHGDIDILVMGNYIVEK